MPDKKSDRRVNRTRELLLNALVSLLMERGYEKLTIQNLLDRAGVGRATFYAHFQGKEELLCCSIARLRAALDSQWKSAAITRGKPTGRLGFTLGFFQHLESHRRLYHTTIGRDTEWTVELHMQRMLREIVREDLDRTHKGRADAAALDLAGRYVVGTLWAIVVWWMESKKPPPSEEVNQIFQRVAFPGVDAIFTPRRWQSA